MISWENKCINASLSDTPLPKGVKSAIHPPLEKNLNKREGKRRGRIITQQNQTFDCV